MRSANHPTPTVIVTVQSTTRSASLLAAGDGSLGRDPVWGKRMSCEAFLVEPPGGPPVS
jgi:hypothetical protein